MSQARADTARSKKNVLNHVPSSFAPLPPKKSLEPNAYERI